MRFIGGVICVVVLRCLATAFVGLPKPRATPSSSVIARRADGEDDGGFMKFLKVEQDIELSPEEYQVALEAEIEAQRKKYYIGGEVKPNNLVVPWKDVDEDSLKKDAKRTLRKNGIKDPSGIVDDDEEDSEITLQVIGSQDVRIEWMGGAPGQKVGYIVEKKRLTDANFQEIASYEQIQNSYLLAKQYSGEEYRFSDDIVTPGAYTYRILVRLRSGEVNVVDQADITVPEAGGISFGTAGAVFVAFVGFLLVASAFRDPIQ